MNTPAFPVDPPVRPCEPSVRTPALPSYQPITPVAAAAPGTTDAACQTDTTLDDQRWNFVMANIQAMQHQIIAIQNFVLNQ